MSKLYKTRKEHTFFWTYDSNRGIFLLPNEIVLLIKTEICQHGSWGITRIYLHKKNMLKRYDDSVLSLEDYLDKIQF